MIDYFPLGTASGAAFCNRKEELAYLARNISYARPTFIMSPRRYGKTSLALRSFALNKVKNARIDFYKEINEEDIERSILNGIGHLLSQIETKPKQLLKLAGEFFSGMRVSLGINQLQISVEIKDRKKRPADSIQEALAKLDNLVHKKKIIVVFYIDEFQKIADITENHSIEAAIRSVAQITKNITFIFSGSNRHLIEDMFFDSTRPFYKLCDILNIGRINETHYHPYMQKAAIERWGKKIPDEIISQILDLTECHPYYVNLLSSKIWRHTLPDIECVNNCWHECAAENKSQIEREIELLAANQKKLLISLARFGETNAPTSQDYVKKVDISSTSLSQSLASLIDKDYVYKDKQGYYRILDPLFRYVFA